MKQLILSLLISLSVPFFCSAQKNEKPDMKFQKEAATTVWGKESPYFNPKESLTDTIFQNVAAAYIAVECVTDAQRKDAAPFMPAANIDRRYLGETMIISYTRKMVKIIEPSALEDFSSFEFAAPKTIKANANIEVFSSKTAFGARIFKDDGEIITVDISQALPVTEGKKGKASSFRLPIPNLQVGDVLDFFIFNQYTFLGNQGIDTDYNFFERYPIRSYSYNGTFDDILTTSFNTFNGLSFDVFNKSNSNDRTIISLTVTDIESTDNRHWCNVKRQFPFMHIRIEDNFSKVFPTKYHRRRTGFYPNLTTPVIMSEISERFQKNKLPDNAVSRTMDLIKKYRKNRTDISENELCDAAWIAAIYHASEAKETFDNWDVICLFKDVIDRLKLSTPALLAVTTKHTDVWIREVAEIDQVTPLVVIGDKVYVNGAERSLRPGELPEAYAGEEAFTFSGERSNLFDQGTLNVMRLPETKPNDNSEMLSIDLKLSEDNINDLEFNYTNILKGSSKALANVLINSKDFVNQCEDFLEIRPNKRSKRLIDVSYYNDLERKLFDALPEIDLGYEDLRIDSCEVIEAGFLPSIETCSYKISGTIENIVSEVGEDLMINIGPLLGLPKFKATDNISRDIDIWTTGPYSRRTTIKLEIPDGYTIASDVTQQLFLNEVTLCGNVVLRTTISDDGKTITFDSNVRNKRLVYPAKLWDDFIKLKKVGATISDFNLILVKD